MHDGPGDNEGVHGLVSPCMAWPVFSAHTPVITTPSLIPVEGGEGGIRAPGDDMLLLFRSFLGFGEETTIFSSFSSLFLRYT